MNTFAYVFGNPLEFSDPFGLAGQTTNLGNGTTVRIDNAHIPGTQQHAHVKTPKGDVVVNKDGTQSHKSRGKMDNLTKKASKFLKGKGFKLPGIPLLLNPCAIDPFQPGCRYEEFTIPEDCPLEI